MNDIHQQIATEKNNLYRNSYRRVMRWNLMLALTAIILASIYGVMNLTARPARYYASTINGYVIPLHSLSEPVVTSHVLMQWAEVATRTAYNFDFAHHQQQLQQAKSYFTADAWQQFLKALKTSGLLANVVQNKQVMNSVVSGPPVILSQGVIDGRYTWTLQMPLLLTYNTANEVEKGHLLVTLRVSRVPVLSAPKGIQITGFQATPMFTGNQE